MKPGDSGLNQRWWRTGGGWHMTGSIWIVKGVTIVVLKVDCELCFIVINIDLASKTHVLLITKRFSLLIWRSIKTEFNISKFSFNYVRIMKIILIIVYPEWRALNYISEALTYFSLCSYGKLCHQIWIGKTPANVNERRPCAESHTHTHTQRLDIATGKLALRFYGRWLSV